MSVIQYNTRQFINEADSHYTGSIVCFDGKALINQGKVLERYTFVEISDCHGKIRIHRDMNHDLQAFINKLSVVEHELKQFRQSLEAEL